MRQFTLKNMTNHHSIEETKMRTYLNILNLSKLMIIIAVYLCVADVHGRTIFVDDDGINDPGLGDPSISDHWEDGTSEHPFDSIQEGIDAAVDDDEVVVLPGIYTGDGNRDLDYSHGLPDGETRAITVRSIDPNNPEVVDATIVDCGGTKEEPHRGFYFHSGENVNSVLAGLTITGGYGPFETVSWDYWNLQSIGGGVFLRNRCNPTFRNCVFMGNVADRGGGLFVDNHAGATLESCVISQNTGINKGGGIEIRDAGSLSFRDCMIAKNQSESGGGFSFYSSAPVTFTRCNILENRVTNCGGGILCDWTNVYMSDCLIGANYARNDGGACWNIYEDFYILNSVIVGNVAGGRGGGIACQSGGKPIMINCTLTGNRADYGGAIASHLAGSPEIHNCILWDNHADDGPEVSMTGASNRSWFLCSHSILQGGEDGIHMDDNPDHMLEWGEGMIDASPFFMRPSYDGGDGWGDNPNTPGIDEGTNDDFGDLRLQPYSAAIDMGDNSALPMDKFDLDADGDPLETFPYDMVGLDRIINEIVDLGAYEFQNLPDSNCYYIDPIHGHDDNDGSLAAPWRSFRNVISYYSSQYRPSGWVDLQSGDCLYLMDGTYSEIIYPGAWKIPPEEGGGGGHIAYFYGKHGDRERPFYIKAYPGHHPVFDPQFSGMGLKIVQSSFWDVSGIEIRNAYQVGFGVTTTIHVKIHDIYIHDTDGVDNNNLAGLSLLDTREVEISGSEFHDNYDRTCADTEGRGTQNSSNIVIFAGETGGNTTVHDCLIWQSLPTTHELSGAGLKYKHASRDPNSYFHVFNNVFRNCKYFAMQAGTPNTHFHHNTIIGGDSGISCADGGGPTHQVNQLFEFNTFYGTTGLSLSPTILWRNDDFPDDPKNIVFRNNIVYDTSTSYSSERSIVSFGAYMSNELYHILVPELMLSDNCYFNPNLPVQFGFAAGWKYKQGFELGDLYTLSEWQAEYGYDINSIEADPMFVDPEGDDFHLLINTPCSNMGRFANELSDDIQRACTEWF